jgi:hypothetical protein
VGAVNTRHGRGRYGMVAQSATRKYTIYFTFEGHRRVTALDMLDAGFAVRYFGDNCDSARDERGDGIAAMAGRRVLVYGVIRKNALLNDPTPEQIADTLTEVSQWRRR